MEPLLLGLQSQLEEIKGTLRELKAENAVLRNEILGIGNSAGTKAECVGILEKKTLREFVEEIQFDVKSIKREMQNGNPGKSIVVQQLPSFSDHIERTRGNDAEKNDNISHGFRCGYFQRGKGSENIVNVTHETQDEFSCIEIKHKTIKEERAWMKSKFHEERAKLPEPAVGASLAGKTVESISSSIRRPRREPSCVLKLSNHLNSDLLDPQEYIWSGIKKSGPTNVIVGHSTEAFSYRGTQMCTKFILSVRVIQDLRLAVAFATYRDAMTTVNLGFVPNNIPTDLILISDMEGWKSVPDICSGSVWGSTVEYFISHGNFLARAQASPGPRSIVHLDLLESVPTSLLPSVLNPFAPNNLAELVEIVNCLNVPLKNPRIFAPNCKGELSEVLPAVVSPFSREAFISLDNADLGEMFSYEIASTDLGLAVAYGFQGMNPAFSAAFVPLPVETDGRAFNLAMDPEQWKCHLYKKYAYAKDGEQEIQIRNIRVRVRMTDEEKPQLKILIFTV